MAVELAPILGLLAAQALPLGQLALTLAATVAVGVGRCVAVGFLPSHLTFERLPGKGVAGDWPWQTMMTQAEVELPASGGWTSPAVSAAVVRGWFGAGSETEEAFVSVVCSDQLRKWVRRWQLRQFGSRKQRRQR